MSKTENKPIKGGAYCKCNACGFEGYAYGAPTSKGVTSAYCNRCGINNQLIEVKKS